MNVRRLLPVLALIAIQCASATTPQSVVETFYDAYIANRPAGLPEGATLDRLRPFLSTRLQKLIDDALVHQRDFIVRNPNDKPPFVDGDHFSSLFEGPTSYRVMSVESAADGTWNVRVQFDYQKQTQWEDVVVVTRDQNRYVIDDVILSGAGEFNPAGRLSETLRDREP